jgi:hypothetical protein
MGMRRSLQTAVATGLALLAAAGAFGQEQRGAIEGVVRDAQGATAPGVAVTARNTSGLGVEAATDRHGVYRFASLPPGRYEVSARLAGFLPARVVNVDLRLGNELRIDVTLQPAGPDETVEVVSESPLVAITQSASATSLREEEIEKMPRGRDFTSLATQVAGANDERKLGGISIDGSSGAENRVLIDGAETSDTWLGTPAQFLVTDFVDELQVKSSGYSAEYGGSTGGVLNATTKTGTNDWHGEALVYWSGDDLDASSRPKLQLNPSDPSRAEYVTYPEDEYRQLEPGFTLSGPVVRDKLWFFAGYIPLRRPLDRTVTFLADGSTGTFRRDLTRHYGAANLHAQLGTRWRTRVAFSSGIEEHAGLLPALDGSSSPTADYSIDDIYPNYSASASVDFTPSSRALLGVRAGYFFYDYYNEGVHRGDWFVYQTSAVGFPGVPPEYQQPRLYANVPHNYSWDRGTGPHLSLQLDGTLFVSAAGEHQLKAGVQLDRVGTETLAGHTGNSIRVFWGQSFAGQRGPFGYYSILSNRLQPNRGELIFGDRSVTNLGFFVQDSWRVGRRLTLNLGLRTENEHVPSFAQDPSVPDTAIHFGFGDKLAPRLGFAWDATGDGRTKLYGSWGVFYDVTKLLLPLFEFGGLHGNRRWYTLDTGDIGTIVDNPACPPECPGRLLQGPDEFGELLNDPDDNRIDPGLDQMRMQEAAVGVERELRHNLSLSARYVRKWLDRAVEDIGTLDENSDTQYWLGNPGFGRAASFYPRGGAAALPFPRAERTYDAVELGLERRLAGHWSARLSYTWSRLHGNYSGLAHSDLDGALAPNWGRVFDYPLMAFDERGQPVYGRLATDRPHQIKAHALLDLAFGTSVGLRWFGASGLPRTRQAAFIPGENYPVFYQGRVSDGRLPFVSQVDLYLQQQVRLGDRLRLTLSANVINLLDQDAATNYYPSELFQGQALVVDETQFYSTGVDTQALIEEQRLARDARFLMDSGYQAPRTIRLGLKLGF